MEEAALLIQFVDQCTKKAKMFETVKVYKGLLYMQVGLKHLQPRRV